MIRLVIADDQALIRAGLRLVAENAEGIEVVGEAADGVEALDVARALRPDVVLMDIAMPRLDGLRAARRLLADADPPKILMLTTFDTDDNLHASLRLGAHGFVLKSSPAERLIDAIRVVAAGDALIDPVATLRLIGSAAGARPAASAPELDALTARERQVLLLLARGLSNREIAEEVVLGEATVRTHVAQVLHKLGLRNRVQAVVFAYETGVVQPGQS
ncbi:response regulator transcription factor [Nonomuraea sp. NPDC050310]|uniref:response regulator transcription factor n=1 Tax=unclassified Nonomuraea TaxID=2593643 RepID=UPI0033EC1D1F